MAIRYEYNSVCCGHLYMETRNPETAQIVTKCNICGQGEYELKSEVTLDNPTTNEFIEPIFESDQSDQIQE